MRRLIAILFVYCQLFPSWGAVNDSTTLFERKKELQRQSATADSLADAGRYEQALQLYQEIYKSKDQVQTGISDLELAKIKSLYKADQLELEGERLKSELQTGTLVIVMTILAVLIAFMFRISHVRKTLQLSERETRKAMLTAKEANKMKNRFLSTMSYNIRIPLNGVVGFSQLLSAEEDIDEETRKEYTTIVQKNSEELMRLVNDVLDLSRLEAGMMKFQIEKHDICQLCNEALYMANMYNEDRADIRFTDETKHPAEAKTDSQRLTQALLSALTYPQKDRKPRTITCTLAYDGPQSTACIRITNSPLADPACTSHEVTVRHEINRLLLEHFGGNYQILPEAPGGPTVVFTYPVDISR